MVRLNVFTHLAGLFYLNQLLFKNDYIAGQSRSSLYAEYASCVGPPKHQGAPLLSKML